MQHRPPVFFRPNSTGRRAHGIVQLTGDPFSQERALLLLGIPWPIIERFLILPEIATRGEISDFIGAKREC